MSLFAKKPTVKEQLRQNDRLTKKTQRDLQRERYGLEKTEKQLQEEIKKAAKAGNKQAAAILAKQLVNLRAQKNKTYAVGSRIQAMNTQTKLMQSNMKIASAMGTTTKSMAAMNKVMDPMKTAETMKEFERQNMKMSMTEDMINDTLDDILDESGDEAETDAIVTQVLDEIGIEISGKMSDAPSAQRGKIGDSDAELERQLAALKAL